MEKLVELNQTTRVPLFGLTVYGMELTLYGKARIYDGRYTIRPLSRGMSND